MKANDAALVLNDSGAKPGEGQRTEKGLKKPDCIITSALPNDFMAVQLDSRAFKALSSPTRVNLLKKLGVKPRSLSSLAEEAGLSVQATDEHMHKLVQAGLVVKDKKSKWAYYQLTAAGRSLVQIDRQPVYLMLAVSMLLFLAAGIAYNQSGAYAFTGESQALPLAAQDTATGSAPLESAAKAFGSAADANGTTGVPAAQPAIVEATALPPESPESVQAVPQPSDAQAGYVEPAAMPLVYLFAAGGALCLAIAVHWWRRYGA